MDPLSQAVTGAIFSQSFATKTKVRIAAICGALGGMAPDLDVLIKSDTDPLLALEYHRHFTHSLIFIPFGGLIIGALLRALFFRKKLKFKYIYLFTTLGYGTHGLLDACTSYGTYLYWPFSGERIAWSTISIIDPIYTLTLIVLCILSIIIRSKKVAITGCLLGLTYIGYGYSNHMSAKEHIANIASERGHTIEKHFMNTTLGNNILWRSVYLSGGRYYVDTVSTPPSMQPIYHQGSSINSIDINTLYLKLEQSNQQAKDTHRFAHFASGYLYQDPNNPNIIGDLRYGSPPHSTQGIWGIEINPNKPDSHIKHLELGRDNPERLEHFSQVYEEIKVAMTAQ